VVSASAETTLAVGSRATHSDKNFRQEGLIPASDTGNSFRYDATGGQYIFNLATKGLSAGTWRIRIAQYQGSTELVTLGTVDVSSKK
jgi:hypothetical protein